MTERRPKHYWAGVLPGVQSVLHYVIIPATGDATSPENPLIILRRVYRSGDFVDPQLAGAIVKMMYEMH